MSSIRFGTDTVTCTIFALSKSQQHEAGKRPQVHDGRQTLTLVFRHLSYWLCHNAIPYDSGGREVEGVS